MIVITIVVILVMITQSVEQCFEYSMVTHITHTMKWYRQVTIKAQHFKLK